MKYKGHTITKAKNGRFFLYGPIGRGITTSLAAAKNLIDLKSKRKTLNPTEVSTPVKAYAEFTGKNKVTVKQKNINWPKQLIHVGEAIEVVYKSDKWDGKTRVYKHDLKKHGAIFINKTTGANMIVITGVNLNMKPEGLTG